MIYYKNTQGEVYAYETEGERQEWGAPDLVPMTSKETEAHLNPVPTAEQLASSARYERDKALKALDEVVSNPIRFSELLEEQRLEAVSYRKLLLDIPQQKSFPTSYTFPKTPEWL